MPHDIQEICTTDHTQGEYVMDKESDTPKSARHFSDFDSEVATVLSERWASMTKNLLGFWRKKMDIWHSSLLIDFKVNDDDVKTLQSDTQAVYKKIYRLEKLKLGTLLPMHTKLYIDTIGLNSMMISLIDDNINLFAKMLNEKIHTHEEIKELQILATFFGSKKVLHYLYEEHAPSIDSEVLNVALLSGELASEELDYLASHSMPTYNSIRYAIKSENLDTVKALLERFPLKPTSEHLVAAASTGNLGIFNFIVSKGANPEGRLVYQSALASKNEAIIERLEEDFGYGGVPTYK